MGYLMGYHVSNEFLLSTALFFFWPQHHVVFDVSFHLLLRFFCAQLRCFISIIFFVGLFFFGATLHRSPLNLAGFDSTRATNLCNLAKRQMLRLWQLARIHNESGHEARAHSSRACATAYAGGMLMNQVVDHCGHN